MPTNQPDVLLAVGPALPTMFQAVEIDREAYWTAAIPPCNPTIPPAGAGIPVAKNTILVKIKSGGPANHGRRAGTLDSSTGERVYFTRCLLKEPAHDRVCCASLPIPERGRGPLWAGIRIHRVASSLDAELVGEFLKLMRMVLPPMLRDEGGRCADCLF